MARTSQIRQRIADEKQNGGHAYDAVSPAVDPSEKTDYTRWRLLDDNGRQTWHYLESDEEVAKWPQTTADKYFLGLPTVRYSRTQAVSRILYAYHWSACQFIDVA